MLLAQRLKHLFHQLGFSRDFSMLAVVSIRVPLIDHHQFVQRDLKPLLPFLTEADDLEVMRLVTNLF